MKSISTRLLICSALVSTLLGAAQLRADPPAKYLDPSVPIEDRINDLLTKMTVDEKISQISDSWGSKGVLRLQIPTLLKGEGLHSQSYSTGATIFPQAICMSSTFNPGLIAQLGTEVAVECKLDHIHSSWSPVLDCARDVRWGRVEETYGESPYLCSQMGVAWIKAFQAENMIAVPKHFAGHGEPRGGRDSNDEGLSERTLREIHLPAFRAAIEEAHAGGVMAAYSTWWDGVPDNASTVLLQQVLRQEWGFNGYVVSDCGGPEHFVAKHGTAANLAEASSLAAKGGVNMECGAAYRTGMVAALDQGLVTPDQLDELVRPILRAKFSLGLFEHPDPAPGDEGMNFNPVPGYDSAPARALAREVEVEGAVLLKNDKNTLPLSKDLKTIAVIGPDADLPMTGDYSPKFRPDQLVSVLAGIKSHVSPTTQVVYAPGLDWVPGSLVDPIDSDNTKIAAAVAAAKGADVAVLVVGDYSRQSDVKINSTTGENNDVANLDFPGSQRELIKAVQATGTPVVLVIVNGKPFTLGWEMDNIPAIMVTWYPGEEGGDATADLLFGDRNPSGRLPVTWPRSASQLPLNYDYHPSGRKYAYFDEPFTPQFWFGYGLSYTQFKYSNLQIKPKSDDPGFVNVTADIQNVGNYDGDEVAELYLTEPIASVSTPVVELQGFQRVSIKKGETKTVSFDLTPYQLSLLDEKMVRRVEPGQFRIHVGGCCPDVPKGVNDDRKNLVGYYLLGNKDHVDPLQGISGDFTEPKGYAAHFVYTMDAPDNIGGGQSFPVNLTVKNDGNLTDITLAKLYSGFELGSWGFELKPGETKSHVFQLQLYKAGDLAVVAGDQMVTKTVNVEKSPGRLEITNVHTKVDNNDVLEATADVKNVGGEDYSGAFQLKVDGNLVAGGENLKLQPGESQHVTAGYTFDVSGTHRVQVADQPEQQIVVAGGISLALQKPLVYLKLDEGTGTTVKNEITGKLLKLNGTPAWVDGKNGKALSFTAAGMSIDAEHLELYRKPFTLAAWVKIDQLGKDKCLALFGGKAPMGADQDNNGTQLRVGLQKDKPFMDFQGREVSGVKEVKTGDWVHLAYTYDPAVEKGTVYLDGNTDKSVTQKTYAGPLETIGDALGLDHGSFAMDEVVITQSCLTSQLVHQIQQHGLESLRSGGYTSHWRTAAGAPSNLTVAADVPDNSSITVTVETADKDGKSLGSSKIQLVAGQTNYPLSGIPEGAQLRIAVDVTATAWGAVPVLRAALITCGTTQQKWSTPNDWADGQIPPTLIGGYCQ